MTIYQEEIFGPVLSVVNMDNFDEAMEIINKHEFGNGTSIYTSNGTFARNFMKNAQIGMVGINIPIPVPMAFYSLVVGKDQYLAVMECMVKKVSIFLLKEKL